MDVLARFLNVGEGWRRNIWRRGRDSNPRYGYPYAAFRVRCFQPLSHLSKPLIGCGKFDFAWPEIPRWSPEWSPTHLFRATPYHKAKRCVEPRGRVGLHRVGHVRVKVHRSRDGGVT